MDVGSSSYVSFFPATDSAWFFLATPTIVDLFSETNVSSRSIETFDSAVPLLFDRAVNLLLPAISFLRAVFDNLV
jgi:hypothetical protein